MLDPLRFPTGDSYAERLVNGMLWAVRRPGQPWHWAIWDGWNDSGTRRLFIELGPVDGLDAEAAHFLATVWHPVRAGAPALPRQPDQPGLHAPIAAGVHLPPPPVARGACRAAAVVACVLPA